MWSYYDWVYCCCRPSVNTICGRIMIGFIVVVKHNMSVVVSNWVVVEVNTICGRIMIGLSLLSSVIKHNMWSYYDWVYCCCLSSVVMWSYVVVL